MKKEISRPWVSDYFAIALQHFFASKVMTQKELATRVGITPATMSDYTNMKRGKGASEDMRRVICKVLGWQYEDMICLGRIIHSGFDPTQWERSYITRNEDPRYQVWTRKEEKRSDGDDILLVPLPGYTEENGFALKTTTREEWTPEHRFTFLPLYTSNSDLGDANAKPVATRAFPISWLADKGIAEGSQCFCFIGMDDALSADVGPRDTILVHIPGEAVQIVEGKIYAIWEPDNGRVLCRRITRREGKVWVYNDRPNIYPPYFAGETNMRILGPVIWIGRDLS